MARTTVLCLSILSLDARGNMRTDTRSETCGVGEPVISGGCAHIPAGSLWSYECSAAALRGFDQEWGSRRRLALVRPAPNSEVAGFEEGHDLWAILLAGRDDHDATYS
jgi:hypothetical protein